MPQPITNAQFLNNLVAAFKGVTTQTVLGATVLEPEQFERYIRQLQYKTTVLPLARLQVMKNKIQDIDRIAFADILMQPRPAEGTEVVDADFYEPTFAQHQLIAVGMQGQVSLTDQSARNNPERQGLQQTIVDMMGERGGKDIELQGINGDTALPADTRRNKLLRLNDGWLKKTRRRVVEDANKLYDDVSTASVVTGVGETTATVYYDNVPITGATWELYTTSTSGTLVADEDGDGVIDQVAASGIGGNIDYNSGRIDLTGLTASTSYYVKYTALAFDVTVTTGVTAYPDYMFSLMLRAIPKQYFERPGDWYIAVPWDVFDAYHDNLRARGTDLGDKYQVQQGGAVLPFKGLNIQYVPNMPLNRAWAYQPDNTLYGVFHEVELENARNTRAKATEMFIDTDTDYQFEEPEASVVAEIT